MSLIQAVQATRGAPEPVHIRHADPTDVLACAARGVETSQHRGRYTPRNERPSPHRVKGYRCPHSGSPFGFEDLHELAVCLQGVVNCFGNTSRARPLAVLDLAQVAEIYRCHAAELPQRDAARTAQSAYGRPERLAGHGCEPRSLRPELAALACQLGNVFMAIRAAGILATTHQRSTTGTGRTRTLPPGSRPTGRAATAPARLGPPRLSNREAGSWALWSTCI